MSFPRRLEPEWLDELPADDPRAIRSRRDIERVNALMFNAGSMATALRRHGADRGARRTIADLGCGDGRFMLQVARRLAAHWPDVTVVLQDKQDIVSKATRDAFAALGWRVETVCGDVFSFLTEARPSHIDIVTCNLFLHHFDDRRLAGLLAAVAELAPMMIACEPRRAKFTVRMSRLLWAVGCNDVSVHDAVTSARAGFRGNELSALWPDASQWLLHEASAALFTHRFVAKRRAPAVSAGAG